MIHKAKDLSPEQKVTIESLLGRQVLDEMLHELATVLRYSCKVKGQHPETGRVEAMKKYLVVVEETGTGYSAYSPDLEGCVATGQTRAEVEKNMRQAIKFHLEGLRVPQLHSYSTYVRIPA